MCVRLLSLLLLAFGVGLPGLHAGEDGWLIVPGRSIGKISIGMEQREVFRRLGPPTMQNDFERTNRHAIFIGHDASGDVPVAEGITQTDWTIPRSLPADHLSGKTNGGFMCDFVTVYTRDRKVVQIEVRVARFQTADGLSIADSAAKWHRYFPAVKDLQCRYDHPSAGGIPATKHFMVFEDDVAAGVAWRYGWFGDLAPEGDPDDPVETVIVHAPGQPLLPDPDGGSRFIWKDDPDR